MPSNNPEYQKEYIRKHYQANKDYYKEKSKIRMQSLSIEKRLYENVKARSKKLNLSFDLEESDIIIPNICPILKVPFIHKDADLTPSVDRLIPELGYVKGNISVISRRANMIKNNATLEEIRNLLTYMEINLS